MANGITYGINFPFRDSLRGDYLQLTELESEEIKADLIHLLLTRKGIPVSTSFLVLSAFASTFVLEKMLIKSMIGYAVSIFKWL